MNPFIIRSIVGLAILILTSCAPPESDTGNYEIVIQGGRVMDPESGLDGVRNIGIRDGRIEAIGSEHMEGERVIDAAGLVVSPGFVDLHAHGQLEESYQLMVQDGVTSGFELEVGTNDVAGWYDERAGGQIINYGVSVGHIPVRMQVMGDKGEFLPSGPGGSESATAEQIAMMEDLLEKGLQQGAVAVGFGLAYTPAATTDEYEFMLRIVASHGTTAHIHVRGGHDGLLEAVTGAAVTGAALHVVHVNSSGGASTAEFLETIERESSLGRDVTTEAYPYEAGMTSIQSALYDDWKSWSDERIQNNQLAETGEFLTRENFATAREQGGMVINHSRTEAMTRTAIEHPLTMIASDGLIANGRGHPRTAGTYSKVLGKYVRETSVLTLMDALRKMTIEPARRLEDYVAAMKSKGRLSVGADADITIFDAATVIDQSTYAEPTLPSDGIAFVLVNGDIVVDNGKFVPDVRAGRAIRVH